MPRVGSVLCACFGSFLLGQVLEESPSCLIDPETRLAMQEQAVMLSKATGYRYATCGALETCTLLGCLPRCACLLSSNGYLTVFCA